MTSEPSCALADFHRRLLATFTTALAAKVRQQEAECDLEEERILGIKEREDIRICSAATPYPRDSQLHQQHVASRLADSAKGFEDGLARLVEQFPLGHKDADPAGALTAHRLRPVLLRHLTRIEAERRATALAAGDGSSSAAAGVTGPGAAPPLLSPFLSPPTAGDVFLKDEETESRVEKGKLSWGRAGSVLTSTDAAASSRHGGTAVVDLHNGAYLTPHPTAPNAPFPRYTSVSGTPTAPPVFVVPTPLVRCPLAPPGARSSSLRTRRTASQQQQQRQRSGVAASQDGYGSQPPVRRTTTSTTAVASVPPTAVETDTVMQLWQTVWLGPRRRASDGPTDPVTASRTPITLLRPTKAMVEAVASVELRSYERNRQRCLEQLGKENSPSSSSSTVADPSSRQCALKERLEQMDALHAAHLRTTEKLLKALLLAPVAALSPSSSSPQPSTGKTGEAEGDPTDAPRARSRPKRPRQRTPSRQRGENEHHNIAPPSQALRDLVADGREELLLLSQPHQLVKRLSAARAGDLSWTGQRHRPTNDDNAGVCWEDVPLPAREEDSAAVDLDRYLWPVELEHRIQHVLVGQVAAPPWRHARLRRHFSLSQAELRRLKEEGGDTDMLTTSTEGEKEEEESARLLSLLPPDVEKRIVELPYMATLGWLYVQGRGENYAEKVELT